MSYSIFIGEGVVGTVHRKELATGFNRVRVEVDEIQRDDAPLFPGDPFTGRTNGRHPSYAGWDIFCRKTGLHKLFFDKSGGLMREHPGCVELSAKDAKIVKDALLKWKKQHPKAKPGWCECGETEECGAPFQRTKPNHVKLDGMLARLIWLDWWITWALKNCEVPALYNH